jgi:hypothetical protein
MRLAYNDSMSPVEKFRYDRNLPNAASRHALDFTNLGACRWREERVKQESKNPDQNRKGFSADRRDNRLHQQRCEVGMADI